MGEIYLRVPLPPTRAGIPRNAAWTVTENPTARLWRLGMETGKFGFDVEKLLIDVLKLMKNKGLLTEEEVLDALWDAKDPVFPYGKRDIKDLIKL